MENSRKRPEDAGAAYADFQQTYFYKADVEGFTFFRVPKALFTLPDFKSLSTDAKLLYGLMLDRVSLSRRNGWLDERGCVFIYYTLEEVMRSLGCAVQKAVKLMAELERIGLVEKKKQGPGRPCILYVKNFSALLRESGGKT